MAERPNPVSLGHPYTGVRGVVRACRLVAGHYLRIAVRAWSDTWRFSLRQGLIAGLVVALLTATADGIGEKNVHVPHLIVAGLAGFGALMLLLFLGSLIVADVRLFEEARAGRLGPDSGDTGVTLAKEFSDWVVAKRAGLPQHGMRMEVGLFPWGGESADTHAQRRRDSERRRDEIEAVHTRARTEYHERFRGRVAAVLGDTPQVRDPRTIADLGGLSALLTTASGEQPSEPIRAPVGAIHERHIHEWLDELSREVGASRVCDYLDLGADQNQQAVAAHFPELPTRLAEWDQAVVRAEAAPDAARDQVETELARAEIPADYYVKPITDVFTRFVVGRAGGEYRVELRAVHDALPGQEPHWSVFTPEGRGASIKVAELPDAPWEEVGQRVVQDERALQAIADRARTSDRLPEIGESRSALQALQQPLLDLLDLQRAVSPVLSADRCPFCEAQRQKAISTADAGAPAASPRAG